MKKILAILALIIMVTILASCGANKESSKGEEAGESKNIKSVEQTNSNIEIKKVPVKINNNKDNIKNNNIKTINKGFILNDTLSGSIGTGKTEDQVVKDFENELDGLFKLLESDKNAK